MYAYWGTFCTPVLNLAGSPFYFYRREDVKRIPEALAKEILGEADE